jgi:hypothetical protein
MCASAVPARVVLENVPRVGFEWRKPRCPEDLPFPSCLRAYLEYMGDGLGCDYLASGLPNHGIHCGYAFLMGVSGIASRLTWDPTQWFGGNIDIIYTAAKPDELFCRAFDALGYSFELVPRLCMAEGAFVARGASDDEACFRSHIMASIAGKGHPLLGFGPVGPPECCIITGYDESGDVLTGWSFFQDMKEFNRNPEFEPSGYFRRRDWFKDMQGILVIGDKKERPPLRDTYRQALHWVIEVARTPVVNRFHSGHAAYTAWAEALLRDADFPAGNMPVLWDRYMVHSDAALVVAEGRWYGSIFLSQIAAGEDKMAEDLLAAASCYAAEHRLMWDVWDAAGGNGYSDAHVMKLADPAVRRQIAPILQCARDKDEEAIRHIERALTKA